MENKTCEDAAIALTMLQSAVVEADDNHSIDLNEEEVAAVDSPEIFPNKEAAERFIESHKQGVKLCTRDVKVDRLVRGCTNQAMTAPCSAGKPGKECKGTKDKCMRKSHSCAHAWIVVRNSTGQWLISQRPGQHSCLAFYGTSLSEPTSKRARVADDSVIDDMRTHVQTVRNHVYALQTMGTNSDAYQKAWEKYEIAEAELRMAQSDPGSTIYINARDRLQESTKRLNALR